MLVVFFSACLFILALISNLIHEFDALYLMKPDWNKLIVIIIHKTEIAKSGRFAPFWSSSSIFRQKRLPGIQVAPAALLLFGQAS